MAPSWVRYQALLSLRFSNARGEWPDLHCRGFARLNSEHTWKATSGGRTNVGVQSETLPPLPAWCPWRMTGSGGQSWKSLWSTAVPASSSDRGPFPHLPHRWEIQALLEHRQGLNERPNPRSRGPSGMASYHCWKSLPVSRHWPPSTFHSVRVLTFKSNNKNNWQFLGLQYLLTSPLLLMLSLERSTTFKQVKMWSMHSVQREVSKGWACVCVACSFSGAPGSSYLVISI